MIKKAFGDQEDEPEELETVLPPKPAAPVIPGLPVPQAQAVPEEGAKLSKSAKKITRCLFIKYHRFHHNVLIFWCPTRLERM